MFGIGSTELLLILVVALIVLGPRSLAGFAKTLGKLMGEFRRVSTEFQRSLNVETARAEAREAEEKRSGHNDAMQTSEQKSEKVKADPVSEKSNASFANIPEDSPVARELARARKEAQQAECDVEKAEQEIKAKTLSNSETSRESRIES